MNRKIYFLGVFVIIGLLSVAINFTHGFFSDSGNSSGNIFAAASIFPTPTPLTNHIVISEIQINGGSSLADHDFIELYNPTNSDIDINGYRLVSRTGNSSSDGSIKSFTSSTIIHAHGFYLWASSGDSTFPASIGADISTTASLTNSMSVGLRNGPLDTGILIDGVGWINGNTSFIEGTGFADAPGGGEILERKALSTSTSVTMTTTDALKGNGYDTNNNSTDFILRTTPQPQNSTTGGTESP